MISRKYFGSVVAIIFLFSVVTEGLSQRRSSRSSREKEKQEEEDKVSFKDKLAYDIHVGNLGFNSGFFISGKFGAGYKVIDPLTIGLGVKAEYGFVNQDGPNDFDIFNYGFYGYTRYRIGEQFYAKGEYNYFSGQVGSDNLADRETVFFPMIGGGYVSGFGQWKYGFEVMLTLGGEDSNYGRQPRDVYSFIEYTLVFTYNL